MSNPGTDIIFFKFTRSDDQQRDHFLNYKAGNICLPIFRRVS